MVESTRGNNIDARTESSHASHLRVTRGGSTEPLELHPQYYRRFRVAGGAVRSVDVVARFGLEPLRHVLTGVFHVATNRPKGRPGSTILLFPAAVYPQHLRRIL